MKLKCIGGTNDGEWHYTNGPDKVGDWVKIPEENRLSILDYNPSKVPEITTLNYNIYKIGCFHFSKDDRYLFLHPEDWTAEEAIKHQFDK